MESKKNIDTVNHEDGFKLTPKNVSSRTSKCKFCSEKFVKKEDYWEHVIVHYDKDRVLKCQFCPFVTDTKQYLDYHINTHTGKKPYKCEQCPFKGANKTILNTHMKKHENFYPFSCQDCSYVCKHRHSFKIHLRKYGHKGLELHKNSGKVTEFHPDAICKLGRKPVRGKFSLPVPHQPEKQTNQLHNGMIQNHLDFIQMQASHLGELIANPISSVKVKNKLLQKDEWTKTDIKTEPLEENASSELFIKSEPLDEDEFNEMLIPEIVMEESSENDLELHFDDNESP